MAMCRSGLLLRLNVKSSNCVVRNQRWCAPPARCVQFERRVNLKTRSRHAVDTIDGVIWVSLGSVLGGMARFWLSGFVARRVGETFPWGTMVINVSGAFLLASLRHRLQATGLSRPPGRGNLLSSVFWDATPRCPRSASRRCPSLATASCRSRSGTVLSLSLCLLAVAVGFAAGLRAFG